MLLAIKILPLHSRAKITRIRLHRQQVKGAFFLFAHCTHSNAYIYQIIIIIYAFTIYVPTIILQL